MYLSTKSDRLGVSVEVGPIRKEGRSRYSWISHRRGPSDRGASSGTDFRTVFLAVLPGKMSPFNYRHKGTPMFRTQADVGPFPGVQTIHDIHGNRRWVLGVFEGSPSTPNWRDFVHAQYFECEGERREIIHGELEAWQRIGFTQLNNEEIASLGAQLWDSWSPEDYDWRTWNSQNFIIYLAFLVMEQDSREDNTHTLRTLHVDLWLKQDRRLENIIIRRHLGSMVGMVALGAVTGGIGAFASWAFGGYNMVEGAYAQEYRYNSLSRLVGRFQDLAVLLQVDI